ncbi:MAG: hypothetical protein CSB06_01530 [Bacteroidia bacterium]|nr:MAG: hypothetical protein CSB06_01530 [Bacteroidia bacterium]
MKKNVSLVLSGGGARGLAHIGVIEVLEEYGFHIQAITGTSMGAFVGGLYAAGTLKEAKQWFYELDMLQIAKLIDFSFSGQGLIKGDKILDKTKDYIPEDLKIEDLPIHYCAIAGDITNKKEYVWKEGSVHQAIRSSIAIPTVFTPVNIDGALLVDGGIFNNLPLNHAERNPDQLLIAVNVNSSAPLINLRKEEKSLSKYKRKKQDFHRLITKVIPRKGEKRLRYFGLINEVFISVFNHTGQLWIEEYKPDLLINVSRKSCDTFDFLKAKEQVEQGRVCTINALKEAGILPNNL